MQDTSFRSTVPLAQMCPLTYQLMVFSSVEIIHCYISMLTEEETIMESVLTSSLFLLLLLLLLPSPSHLSFILTISHLYPFQSYYDQSFQPSLLILQSAIGHDMILNQLTPDYILTVHLPNIHPFNIHLSSF